MLVTGDSWTIKVQNNPGSGWVDSGDQIKFPTTTASTYRFDIQSNDAGNDEDYNDLILPVHAEDADGLHHLRPRQLVRAPAAGSTRARGATR